DPLTMRRRTYVQRAWDLVGTRYITVTVQDQTGEDFRDILHPALSPLLLSAGEELKATVLPAVVGTALGSVTPGPRSGADATVGGQVGQLLGTEMLRWLGVSFPQPYLTQRLDQVGKGLVAGLRTAWESEGSERLINNGARQMADAVGLFFSLLLHA